MTREELLKAVLASGDLPTLPAVASQVVILTSRDDTTLSDIVDLVSQDIGLATKILKVSNSALYQFPQKIGSIQQAIGLLGTNIVQSLILSFSFLSINRGAADSSFDFEKFWERSLVGAVASKLILEKVPGADTEEIFVSGLLQNLGELIFACTFPEEYEKVSAIKGDDPADRIAAEQSVFGEDHCFIGYSVGTHWNFPQSILVPILHHHDPLKYSGEDKLLGLSAKSIYLADLLSNIIYSDKPEEYHRRFRHEAQKLLGFKSECINDILDQAHLEFDQAAQIFGLNLSETKPIQDILQEANIRLSLLNMDYEQINKKLVTALVTLENVTEELRAKNEQLLNLANVDGLTGIYNNRFFQSALEKEINRTSRKKGQLALVLLDIDHFKKFNDTHGHLVGDMVLVEFCKVVRKNLREYDTFARYGGEEFVIILPDTNLEQALLVAENLRKAVEKEALVYGSKTYRVTASFGVSSSEQVDDLVQGKTELFKLADQAVYDAKDSGRNKVAAFVKKKKGFWTK